MSRAGASAEARQWGPGGVAVRGVPTGERVLVAVRPSAWMIVLASARVLIAVVVLIALIVWAEPWLPAGPFVASVLFALTAVATLKLLWGILDWACRSYVLTNRRVLRMAGILRRHTADMPLDRLQHLTLDRSLGERILGLGTIGFATAGSIGAEAYWISVDRAEEKIAEVRRAMAAAGVGGGLGPPPRPIVIGIAGGIGSGKSRVAAEFGKLGAVVIDSDAEAKRLLDRPDVRATLRGWWGDRVLGQDGKVDRKAVAQIVFAEPEQRKRLESLVHPLVKEHRAATIEQARRNATPAVVVDAPLLFEAGVDRECDTIIFVDAPLGVREARVRATREWGEGELARRESQQLDVAQKKARSTVVIPNNGDEESLAREASRVYRAILDAPRT